MAGEGEGEVHNVNGEFRIGGGRGNGGRGRGGNRGRSGVRGGRGELEPFGFNFQCLIISPCYAHLFLFYYVTSNLFLTHELELMNHSGSRLKI